MKSYILRICVAAFMVAITPNYAFPQNFPTVYSKTNIKQELQKENNIKELGIGDRAPAIEVNNIINYPISTLRLSDFKDKLLILDFMAVGCVPCIEVLPKFDSLQKQFGDRLQILLITNETPEKVRLFLGKNVIAKKINLPWVVGDTLLRQYFPHEYISHEVWIKNGIVKAITRSQYVNAGNIQTIFNGASVNWPIKKDVLEYNGSVPLMILNSFDLPESSYPKSTQYSVFTGQLSGVASLFNYFVDSSNNMVRINMVNLSIIEMYLKSLKKFDYPSNRIILELCDKNRVLYNPDSMYKDVWRQQNTFCYETVFRIEVNDKNRSDKIINDLNFYFKLNGRIEKRKVKCFLLIRTNGNNISQTLNNNISGSKEKMISISKLLARLNRDSKYPIIDETGDTEKIYLKFDENSFSDMEKLKKEFKKYGLDIKTEERELEVFVLSEK